MKASLERKVYWKLLMPGEIIQPGDQYRDTECGEPEGWFETQHPGNIVKHYMLYRRKVEVE